MITGDPKRAVRKLAVPMMISMLLIMAYNLVDSVWVAGLGSDALAALGFVTPVFMILIGLGNGIGAGANSLIARNIGAKDKENADNSAIHSLIMTLIISIIAPMVLLPILKNILLVMGAGSSVELGLQYGNVIFLFMIVFLFSSVGAAVLRSEGDVKRATYSMAITAILNMILDPIFIYTLGMGMAGAAWATIISAGISCIVIGYWIWVKKDTYLTITRDRFHYKKDIVKGILLVAIPATIEFLAMSVLSIIMNTMLVIVGGTSAVAVYTAGFRLIQMATIPIMGFGTALLTVAGASYGSRRYDNLEIAYNYSIKLCEIMALIMIVLIYVFADQISIIFCYSSASVVLAPRIAQFLRIMSFFLLAMPMGVISASTFQGVGKGTTSLILTLIRSLIFESVFAYIFGLVLGWGETGMYIGIVIGVTLGSLVSLAWGKLFISRLKKLDEEGAKKDNYAT
ncbi:MAG: MATE family efflux transporter [Methanobacteriaceae archaeon]|nr:MATE family efflux transporter [Methanobacteriaceae archaeon]